MAPFLIATQVVAVGYGEELLWIAGSDLRESRLFWDVFDQPLERAWRERDSNDHFTKPILNANP